MHHDAPYTPISVSELGTLWMAYQQKTMSFQMLRHLSGCAEDDEVRKLLLGVQEEDRRFVDRIAGILKREGAALPIGFGDADVNPAAPPLYNGLFEVSIVRMLAKISMGLYALHLSMSFRKDVRELNEEMTRSAQKLYHRATELMMARGMLVRPPIVTPPGEAAFVKDVSYMKRHGVWHKARPINAVEAAHLYQQYETNLAGFEMMTGFAQTAQSEEAKAYFVRGRELARETIDELGSVLKESDMDPGGASGGRTTESTTPTFSDKLMMYCTNVFTSFGLGGNALGTTFSLRSDLPMKLLSLATKVYQFALDGGKLMIEKQWMEEPPQAENRELLIGST